MVFSDTEIKELLKAWAAISVAFAIASGGINSLFDPQVLSFSALTVGLGFLIHEMGHKFVAQHFGYPAEFRAFNTMLIAAIFLSFTGFVFAVPGAVFIAGLTTVEENGKVSAAGPGASLLLALSFFTLSAVFNHSPIFAHGFAINSWWAFFNLLPLPNFDGPKIYRWNKFVYATMVSTAFAFSFLV